MITEVELRRLAAQANVDPMLQDLDYALGWFVAGFFGHTQAASSAVFKGGHMPAQVLSPLLPLL